MVTWLIFTAITLLILYSIINIGFITKKTEGMLGTKAKITYLLFILIIFIGSWALIFW